MKNLGLLILISLVAFGAFDRPAVAGDDDDGWDSESGWEDLDDGKSVKKENSRAMAMGPATLPAGRVALRMSAGGFFGQFGAHVGLLDRLDLILEGETPWTDMGNTWIAGGGLKVLAIGKSGGLQYTFKLKVLDIMYSDPSTASSYLPEGVAIWPSMMVGMNVKGGCFYGEIGAFIVPQTTSDSNYSSVFMGVPAHFGGEIYITDWMHVFINVDLIIGSPIGFTVTSFVGPFNIVEFGTVFII